MIVVADTSPLNYLIRLGHIDLLAELYGRVWVPRAVLREMRHPEAPVEVRAWASSPPLWLEEFEVEHLDRNLAAELGLGEREAIHLALEVRADVLLMDDWAGRQEAEARQLHVAGTLAVLLEGAVRGRLQFPDELDRLQRFGFRASPRVVALMMTRYRQAKAEG